MRISFVRKIHTKVRTDNLVVFSALFFSFLHVILRVSETSSFSVFRLITPILLLYLLLKNSKYIKLALFFFFFLIYNFILSYFYDSRCEYCMAFTFHYSCLFTLGLSMHYLIKNAKLKDIYTFLKYSLYLFIIIWIAEYIFKFNLPNVAIYSDGSRSSVFWVQNDFATGIIGFLPLFLIFEKQTKRIVFLILVSYIFYVNDSKVALIAFLLVINVFFLLKFSPRIRIIFFSFISIFFIVIVIFFAAKIQLNFRDNVLSLSELIIDPINHIFSLKPYADKGGSIQTRTNAMIYALQTFKESFGLGIGAGNTITMLQKPEYKLISAKSIHNFPVQIIVENGLIAIIAVILLLRKQFSILFLKSNTRIDKLYLLVFSCYIIGTLSSSVGIFSNYFFWANLFFVLMLHKSDDIELFNSYEI